MRFTINFPFDYFHVTFVAIAICAYFMGCASSKLAIPQQIPNAVHQTCDTYTKLKPQIIQAREFAKAHWDQIPPEAQQVLKEIDGYLPQLDKIGLDICAASEALKLLELNQNPSTRSALVKSLGNVDWDQALTLVMKAANAYVTLKQTGAV
jgi:hypothetical protein